MSDENENKVDVRGLQPPAPNLQLKDAIDRLPVGSVIEVTGDKSASRSLQRFIRTRGHETLSLKEEGDSFVMVIKKITGPGEVPLDCIIIKD
ncbi:MAG: sulfurtransferase TusA family protein [Dehalococcoidales bacterium]|nr:sulfurtransferase TusA family protein [Dehalococcoidales bacterium]